MNRECEQCKAFNPQDARFCRSCGASLEDDIGQTTVVLPRAPFPPGIPPEQFRTIVPRSHETGEPTTVLPATERDLDGNQREHTVFCLDTSASMGELYSGRSTKLEAACKASVAMVLNKGQIDPLDEIALVTFRSKATVHLGMSPIATYKMDIIEAIQSLAADNGTDINAGLKATRGVFNWARQDVVRRIVLLTDGQGGQPLGTAEDLKARGVVIDVIGVGADPSGVDEKLLRKVASFIDGELHYHFIKDQQTLTNVFLDLAHKTQTA